LTLTTLLHVVTICSGFGSGDYVTQGEASDVLSDLDGRWVRFDLSGKADGYLGFEQVSTKNLSSSINTFSILDSKQNSKLSSRFKFMIAFSIWLFLFNVRHNVIVESSKKLPEHLAEVDMYNKVPLSLVL